MQLIDLEEIKRRINLKRIVSLQEEGFVAYSAGRVDVPPVGYIKMEHSPVQYHLKYGVIQGDDVFVVKLAGGLEQSTEKFGPAKLEGMFIVISALTGIPLYLLQDNGYLTSLRTAVAGLIAAKHLAPKKLTGIGVLGTGTQARMQVEILESYTDCRDVYLWGRNRDRMEEYQLDMESKGWKVHLCENPHSVAQKSNLIVTTTCSKEPLLHVSDVNSGTHITALGADSPGKQELDPKLFSLADLIVADSKSQCLHHGELSHAKALINEDQIVELGLVGEGRTAPEQLTIIDLTGVAVQDIQIAKAVISS